MLRRLLPVAIVLTILQAMPSPVAASSTCNGDAPFVEFGSTRVWIDDRRAKGDGLWLYLENHDKPGLQRGGTFLGFEDPCDENHSDVAILYVP